MAVIKDMHDYLFEKFEMDIEYRLNHSTQQEYYRYIDELFESEESLLEECRIILEDRICSDLRTIVLGMIDSYRLLICLRDYFDWNNIIYCDECCIYYDNTDEHECDEEHTEPNNEPIETNESSDDPSDDLDTSNP